jgi:hypothetical protein
MLDFDIATKAKPQRLPQPCLHIRPQYSQTLHPVFGKCVK